MEAPSGRLSGKIALITGGAGGQGAAFARLFAREGARVILTDVADREGEAIAAEIGPPGQAAYMHHDVRREAEWRKVADACQERFGGLNVLVNNAGIMHREGIMSTRIGDWQNVIEVNLSSALMGMQACAPLIRDAGGGSIINISSTAGMTAHPSPAYSASKWGLRGLTKVAAAEFVEWNIRVNSVHPALVANTSFMRTAKAEFLEANNLVVPMGRAATPEEVANVVLFLASEDSSYITGAEIPVDGGILNCGLAHVRRKIQRELSGRK